MYLVLFSIKIFFIEYTENETNGNDNCCLYAANRKCKMANLHLFAASRNGKQKFVFLARQTKYSNCSGQKTPDCS